MLHCEPKELPTNEALKLNLQIMKNLNSEALNGLGHDPLDAAFLANTRQPSGGLAQWAKERLATFLVLSKRWEPAHRSTQALPDALLHQLLSTLCGIRQLQ